MASVSLMSMPLTPTKTLNKTTYGPSLLKKPNMTHDSKSRSNKRVVAVQAKASSIKEKVVLGLTSAAFTASMVIPEVAEAAGNGITPSLKNLLLSVAAGSTVVVAIIGAVVGVSNFDPVKRN